MSKLKINWLDGPQIRVLDPENVHIWAAPLSRTAKETTYYTKLLSNSESIRSAKLHFRRDYDRFVNGRGLLRSILASYFEIQPKLIEFKYSKFGKPALAKHKNADDIHFNLAHADDLILLAIARNFPVGIDVELVREFTNLQDVANAFFSPTEAASLSSISAVKRPLSFFKIWTRKEALAKATGEGLGGFLNQTEISLSAKRPSRHVSLIKDKKTSVNWNIYPLNPATNFVGALATQARPIKLSCWRWPHVL